MEKPLSDWAKYAVGAVSPMLLAYAGLRYGGRDRRWKEQDDRNRRFALGLAYGAFKRGCLSLRDLERVVYLNRGGDRALRQAHQDR